MLDAASEGTNAGGGRGGVIRVWGSDVARGRGLPSWPGRRSGGAHRGPFRSIAELALRQAFERLTKDSRMADTTLEAETFRCGTPLWVRIRGRPRPRRPDRWVRGGVSGLWRSLDVATNGRARTARGADGLLRLPSREVGNLAAIPIPTANGRQPRRPTSATRAERPPRSCGRSSAGRRYVRQAARMRERLHDRCLEGDDLVRDASIDPCAFCA